MTKKMFVRKVKWKFDDIWLLFLLAVILWLMLFVTAIGFLFDSDNFCEANSGAGIILLILCAFVLVCVRLVVFKRTEYFEEVRG